MAKNNEAGVIEGTLTITARIGALWLTALTAWVTTGMPARRPSASVEESTRSRRRPPVLRNCTALARSIRCGKSRFHSCGGTYGHLVRKHMAHR